MWSVWSLRTQQGGTARRGGGREGGDTECCVLTGRWAERGEKQQEVCKMEGGGPFHLGRQKEEEREDRRKNGKSPRCQQEGRKKKRGGEVLGVLVVGRGAGIQGNGLFFII